MGQHGGNSKLHPHLHSKPMVWLGHSTNSEPTSDAAFHRNRSSSWTRLQHGGSAAAYDSSHRTAHSKHIHRRQMEDDLGSSSATTSRRWNGNTPEGQQRLLNMAIVVLTKSIQKRLDAEMKNTQLPQDQLDYLKDLTRALDAEVKKSENGQRGGPQRGGPQPGGAQRGGAQRGGPQHGGPQIGGPQQSGGQHGGGQHGGGQQNGGRSGW